MKKNNNYYFIQEVVDVEDILSSVKFDLNNKKYAKACLKLKIAIENIEEIISSIKENKHS